VILSFESVKFLCCLSKLGVEGYEVLCRRFHFANPSREVSFGEEGMDEIHPFADLGSFLTESIFKWRFWPGTLNVLEHLRFFKARMMCPQILTTTDCRSYCPGISHVAVWISQLHSTW
jgi:hypothetical protein